jgi:hypothetical protein
MSQIKCEWMAKNSALANIDGQVYPCCYLANTFTLLNIFGRNIKDDFPEELNYGGRKWVKSEHKDLDKKIHLAEEYLKNKDALNLKNNSLEDILNHEWFVKTLPESWEDENLTHRQCKKHCTTTSEHYHPNKSKSRNND